MSEEKNGPEQKSGHDKKIIIISILTTLAVVIVFLGVFLAWKKYSKNQKDLEALKQQMENIEKAPGASSEEPSTPGESNGTESPPAETAADEYAGWKTYTNSEIGYTLRYPANWTLKEINQFSELLDATVKYITLNSPGKKYFLQWGLKQKTDAFVISDRTGIGAGDFQKDGKTMIIGKDYDITRFVYKGKTKEVFYPSSGIAQTADGKYDFVATLSYGTGSNYDTLDIDNIPEKFLAEKILKSVTLSEKTISAAGCSQSFTNEDNLNKADWKTYSNAKYGYSFKYPKDWTITGHEDKRVNMENAANHEYFSWNSEEMTAFDYMGYHETNKKDAKIACQNGEKTFLSGDAGTPNEKSRLTFVDFKKGGKRHLITFNYQDFGASISSDIVEMFDLIIKTVEFNK